MGTPETGPQLVAAIEVGVLDQLPVGVAELAVDGTVLGANRALLRLLRHPDPDAGLPASGGLALERLGWALPGGSSEALRALLGASDGDRVAGQVLRLRHEDGTDLFLKVFVCEARTADPRVVALATFHDATAEVLARQELAESERRLRLAFDASPDGWAVFSVTPGSDHAPMKITDSLLNARARTLAGRQEADLRGAAIDEVLGWASSEWVHNQMEVALIRGEAPPTRTPVMVLEEWRLIESSVVRLDDRTVLCSWRDVTELVDAERRLNAAYEETAEMRATLQTALDATSDGFCIYQLEWDDAMNLTAMRVVHANAAGAESLGLDPDTLIGMEIHDFFPSVEEAGLWARIVEAAVTKEPQHHRVFNHDEDGRFVDAWDNTIAPVGEERMAITWRDVTEEERAKRQLARTRDEAMHSATHDALTDLPNRVLLFKHLHQALHTCTPDERVALVFVDLDHFKAINDTYGHAAGDAVLKATASRLEGMVRHGDLAARLAGDEFVIVLTHLPPEWTPDQFFARATAMLSEPVLVEGVELHPSASLGAVLADPNRERVDTDDLVKRADAEMYRSKASRR